MKQWAARGFTIVELLIVVVIIAILATIAIVAYSGIQQRANNAAIIDAASKSLRLIQAYVAANGTYPYEIDSIVCITSETSCRRNSGPIAPTAAFDTAMSTIGLLPRSAPLASSVRGGVVYNYNPARTVSGSSAPSILSYYLIGINTKCGLPVINTENPSAVPDAAGYSNGNVGSSGLTQCVVSIPGPGV